jgi:hypothetical protein
MTKSRTVALCRSVFCIGLVLLSASLAVACASECTLIACSPHAEVELKPPLDLAEGDKIEVTLDDKTKVECMAMGSCSDSRVQWLYRGKETSSGGGTTQNAGGQLVGVSVQGKLGNIAVRLYGDGEIRGEAEVTPKYRGIEINGPGCGECDMASETVTLSQP